MDQTTIQAGISSFDKILELLTENNIYDIMEAATQNLKSDFFKIVPKGSRPRSKTHRQYCFLVKDLKENLRHYKWFYNKLEEPRSKDVFLNLIRYRILPDKQFLRNACDKEHEQYFDPELIRCDKDEVFVDCGGFTGDTVESFIRNCGDYKHIYTYEPSAENLEKSRQTAGKYENITVKPFGVGKKEDIIPFSHSGPASSFIVDNNNISEVRITSLDADIKEPVSFIKMDVEGFETDALIGAKRHIRKDNPKLAVCIYHLPSDFWEIPRLIHTINPNYDFYLRHYSDEQHWETVVYAIPKAKEKLADIWADKPQTGVYAVNGYYGYWTNLELTKDCGMVPFLFYKKYSFRAVMVSEKIMEYPYLDTYLKGLSMDFTRDRTVEARCEYITEHYRDMDILILYGPYPPYYAILETYRKFRPDGKVYLALDANSVWMDRTNWNTPDFLRFMDRCDIIATSCKRMQRNLSIKWPYIIEYIPNGYYNYLGSDVNVNLSAKQNVILTVGRIGTAQKNNELLLEAFAEISTKIPDWSLKLVGNIQSSFQEYIHKYFEKNPQLKDRVTFTGIIEDKQKLLLEYRKAKIFALTSVCEGGNPNAVTEALFSGCYIFTSDIDASEDITNHGGCGTIFPDGDQCARMLADVCNNPERIEAGGRNALAHARLVYDYSQIISRLHYLLFA